ncbi:hypothetical protein D4765_15650 [Subtercola vilae]|uniref:DUF2971 domain-containing protein n=2 Tax=Subtercola vilae TaxID=2056433 RepID=A0A4V4RE14_9MICO|nr:hypothetical protein D4765_15650 [Subtercola vilae]
MVGDNVLWASAMALMNDFRELRTGKKIFKQLRKTHVDDVEEQIRGDFDAMIRTASKIDPYRTFVACASEQPDRLTMWRNYAGEVGYAVALDSTKPLYMRRQRPMTEEKIAASGLLDEESKQRLRDDANSGSPKFEWTRVVYKPDAQYLAAWKVLLDIEAAAAASAEGRQAKKGELYAMLDMATVISAIKDPAFEDETETRLVCNAAMYVDLMYLKHRPGKYGMIPYVELGLPKDPGQLVGDGPEPMGNLPIIEVIIGPTRYPKDACAGVRELLRSHGHTNIPVTASRIPFRP